MSAGTAHERLMGSAVKRLDLLRFVRGQGRFVDDLGLPHMLHAAVLRSPHAHARIRGVDTTRARGQRGVAAVFTFADIASAARPIPVRLNPYNTLDPYLQYPLARDRVRYVGEPLALVVAHSRHLAEDALAAIEVDYEPLPVVVDARTKAMPAALHPAAPDNVASRFVQSFGDVEAAFAGAARVVRAHFTSARHSGVPLETRGLLAHYDAGTNRLQMWGPAKVPHFNRGVLARMLELPEQSIHFIEPDVGGGFGVRGEFYPEDFLVPFAARRLGRPVKWTEDRLEHLVATNHSREQHYEMEAAVRGDGTLLGVRVRLVNDMGAYMRTHGVIVPELSAGMFPGPYRWPSYHCEVRCVLTNKTPTGTYRGPGRFECNSARERLLDCIALELDLDPAVLRLRNLVEKHEMPYTVGTQALGEDVVYDSGDYPAALHAALELSEYRARRERRRGPDAAGARRTGLGIGCFVEKTGKGPFEGARVEVDAGGFVAVSTGASSVGQGIETCLAQIVGDVLEVPLERVSVRHGDTDLIAYGVGSFASRATVMAGNAAHRAALQVRARALHIAARLLAVDPDSVALHAGAVVGPEGRRLTLGEIAQAAAPHRSAAAASGGPEPGLAATCYFECEHMTYSYGTAIAAVEVDPATGRVALQDIWVVYDVGRVVNPQAVGAQIEGGAAQGLGGALLEEFAYDEEGQLLSGSFMDYLLPTADAVPRITHRRIDRAPSPLNPLGLKGAGEAGAVGTGAAIANAVADALGGFGAQVDRFPLTPERVWRWAQGPGSTESSRA